MHDEGETMLCEFCGGETASKRVRKQHWWHKQLYVLEDVPAEVCRECGERYFHAQVLDAIERILETEHLVKAHLQVEVVSLQGVAVHGAVILYVVACPLGRDESNPLCIPDNRVSRSQAVIIHQHGGFWLKDAGSRNGTFINQEPCVELTPIISGDVIQFGKSITLSVL